MYTVNVSLMRYRTYEYRTQICYFDLHQNKRRICNRVKINLSIPLPSHITFVVICLMIDYCKRVVVFCTVYFLSLFISVTWKVDCRDIDPSGITALNSIKPESPIGVYFVCSLFPKALHSDFYFTLL